MSVLIFFYILIDENSLNKFIKVHLNNEESYSHKTTKSSTFHKEKFFQALKYTRFHNQQNLTQ